MKSFNLHYSEALIRSAVWAYWWRMTGWRYLAAMAIIFGSCSYLLRIGDRSWWLGASTTVLVMGVGAAVALYINHFRGPITRFRLMKSPVATMELSDDRFRMTSDIGSSEMAWSTITEVWQFPEFWLVFLSRAQFFTLPLVDLDNEARDFILGRAKIHGAKVS